MPEVGWKGFQIDKRKLPYVHCAIFFAFSLPPLLCLVSCTRLCGSQRLPPASSLNQLTPNIRKTTAGDNT